MRCEERARSFSPDCMDSSMPRWDSLDETDDLRRYVAVYERYDTMVERSEIRHWAILINVTSQRLMCYEMHGRVASLQYRLRTFAFQK